MKIKKLLRVLGGIVILFSLLIAAIPALPAQAATYTIDLDISEGPVGTEVTITGTSFLYNSTYDSYVTIYFSSQNVALPSKTIDTSVKTYAAVAGYDEDVIVDSDGAFDTTFTVPSSLVDGDVDLASVTAGDYYVYVTETAETTEWNGITSKNIRSKTAFTVTASAGTLDPLSPASGPAGTSVTISGSSFPASTALVFKYGSTTITPASGDTSTRASGVFISTITIPQSTAGAHTITVTAGSKTATATFTVTVTAAAALDPLSPATGPVGTSVTVSGSGFSASTALVFKYDSTTVTPASGDTSTRASGIFISTITIPQSTAGAHTITVTAGSGSASATFTVTGATTATPTLTLSSASATPGGSITVSGTGFAASTTVTISLGTASATATTDASGAFSNVALAIPGTLAAGTYNVSASDASSHAALARLTVQAAATTPPTTTPTTTLPLSLSQTTGSVGSYIMVGGAGFQANAAVIIKYDGTQVATATVQAGGAFVSGIFQVPVSKAGSHTITATDGIHTGSSTFTVAAATIAAPVLQSPAKLAKASAPATFTWGAVTAESAPVTYVLQIATDSQFTSDSIILNKIGLAKTTYTLTDAEQTKLNASAASLYYWRALAVDAAQNTSAWSAAIEFYASAPFKFVESPYFYVAIAFGAVVLFLIGFLIGRRTAYYY